MNYQSTKIIHLGSTAFRQWRADSHCRFIHGYRLSAKIWFQCNKLDGNGWVYDFGKCKNFERELKEVYDHKLCVAKDDPNIEEFKNMDSLGLAEIVVFENGVGIEKFTKHVFDLVDEYVRKDTDDRVYVKKVEIWEHELNSAILEA